MEVQTWGEVITASLQLVWTGFIAFLPKLLLAIIIFLIGWFVAVLLGKFAAQIIRTIRIDQILERVGFKKKLEKADLKLDSGRFFGELVKWFFIIVFLMAATDILGLPQITDFLERVLLYIPHLLVAILILLAAVLIANFLEKLVRASVETAGLRSANFLAAVSKWAIMIFALLAALLQLGIVPSLIQTVFTGLVAALAISVGLAFGLGGKDLASQILSKIKKDVSGE